MEDKEHELEHFFRKKLAEQVDNDDAWDKPDQGIWAQAQTQIPIYSQKKIISKKWLAASFFCIAFLALVSYVYILQTKIENLEKTQLAWETERKLFEKNQTEQVLHSHANFQKNKESNRGKIHLPTNVDKSFERLEKKQSKKKNKEQNSFLSSTNFTKKSKHFTQNADNQLNKNTNFENTQTTFDSESNQTFENTSVDKYVDNLQEGVNSTLEHQVKTDFSFSQKNMETIAVLAENTDSHKALSALEHKTTTPITVQKYRPIQPFITDVFTLVKTTPKHDFSYEIGYEFGLLYLNMPASKSIKDQGAYTYEAEKNTASAKTHGLAFAFSPRKNWFIQTGFRGASFAYEQQSKFSLIYDKSKTYLKPDGTEALKVDLNKTTFYTNDNSTIDLSVPNTSKLETGDAYTLVLDEYRDFSLVQIPLGLAFNQKINVFHVQFQGGYRWNKIKFKDYKSVVSAYSVGEKLNAEEQVVAKKVNISKQFSSAYLGLGVQYSPFPRWNIRLSSQLDYDFIKNTGNLSLKNSSSKSLSLGLYYTF